jgi:hypothetical protein
MMRSNIPTDGPYSLITGSDTMHYSKQNPAYYAEIIARIGVEPDEALVIGDSLQNDIISAQAVGLHAIHLDNSEFHSFAGVISHLKANTDWRQQYKPKTLTPNMIIPQWHGNIAALFALLADVKDHFWQQQSIPGEWTILQILSHLLQVEPSIHRARLERIRQEQNPFITASPPPGPDIPIHDADGYAIAAAFLEERKKTTIFIETLSEKDWYRPAQHSIFSKTTLLEMAHFTAQHDRLHINQLCQTLGHCQ